MNKWKVLEIIQEKGGKEISGWRAQGKDGRKERNGNEATEEMVCLWIAVGLIHSPCCNLQKLCVCQSNWLPHFASWISEKMSLLSRLFRRSGRKQRGLSAPPVALATFSAQFPPAEWFNQRVVHLHSIGTQTLSSAASQHSVSVSRFIALPSCSWGLYAGRSLLSYVLRTFSVIVSQFIHKWCLYPLIVSFSVSSRRPRHIDSTGVKWDGWHLTLADFMHLYIGLENELIWTLFNILWWK